MIRRRGDTFLLRSSQQLPRLCLGPLKGFSTDTVPFKGIASETIDYTYCQVWCTSHRGLMTPSRTTDTNYDCAFV